MSNPNDSLVINEIFFSIQGESTFAGQPCAFVRLMGCPLRCSYCDTEYAFYEGKRKSFDEILEVLKSYPTQLVEITGGEPLAQKNVIALMNLLISQGYQVLLETSGAYPIQDVPAEVQVIMDVKTPSSNEKKRMYWDNMGFLKTQKDEVKFVIGNREDFDFALQVAQDYKLFERVTVLASPVHGKLDNKTLAEWILESGKNFRFQVQLHKYIWGEHQRGV